MTNFIFKSANRLIKNSPNTIRTLDNHLEMILREQRHQRADLRDINRKIDRLLVDKHLQMQVDEYFDKDPFGSAFKTGNTIKEEDEL